MPLTITNVYIDVHATHTSTRSDPGQQKINMYKGDGKHASDHKMAQVYSFCAHFMETPYIPKRWYMYRHVASSLTTEVNVNVLQEN